LPASRTARIKDLITKPGTGGLKARISFVLGIPLIIYYFPIHPFILFAGREND
jgi:hypothetical protein